MDARFFYQSFSVGNWAFACSFLGDIFKFEGTVKMWLCRFSLSWLFLRKFLIPPLWRSLKSILARMLPFSSSSSISQHLLSSYPNWSLPPSFKLFGWQPPSVRRIRAFTQKFPSPQIFEIFLAENCTGNLTKRKGWKVILKNQCLDTPPNFLYFHYYPTRQISIDVP